MSKKIGDISYIVVDCEDNERIASFWSQLLDLEITDRSDPYIDLAASNDNTPTMCFQKVSEPKITKNRVHVDVKVANLETATKRIEAIGGRFIQEFTEGTYKWHIMADPEDNEFCIFQKQLNDFAA